MRSIMKKIMRISLIILVAGIVLVVLGIILGGKPSFSIDLKKHKIYTNLDAVSEETVITGEFKNIDVKADTEDVEIILTEEESYKVEYRVMGREPKIKVPPLFGVRRISEEQKRLQSDKRLHHQKEKRWTCPESRHRSWMQ